MKRVHAESVPLDEDFHALSKTSFFLVSLEKLRNNHIKDESDSADTVGDLKSFIYRRILKLSKHLSDSFMEKFNRDYFTAQQSNGDSPSVGEAILTFATALTYIDKLFFIKKIFLQLLPNDFAEASVVEWLSDVNTQIGKFCGDCGARITKDWESSCEAASSGVSEDNPLDLFVFSSNMDFIKCISGRFSSYLSMQSNSFQTTYDDLVQKLVGRVEMISKNVSEF